SSQFFFIFIVTATSEICTLSLHDALPISTSEYVRPSRARSRNSWTCSSIFSATLSHPRRSRISSRLAGSLDHSVESLAQSLRGRSEEHTSELQSRRDLVCRLLLEKKKTE